jgi:energy-coupling factor transporter ATP-binding protein EcfA2
MTMETHQSIDDLKPKKLKTLLIGPTGSGKTHQLTSLGMLDFVNSMWVASFEGGIATARAARKRLGITPSMCRFDYEVYIEDNRKCPNEYKRFMADYAKACKSDVDVIGLDGIGPLSKYCFWDQVATNNLVDKKYGDTTFHLYRLLMDKMSDVITMGIKSSKLLVVTCHPDWDKDENTGEVFVYPDVEGKSTRQSMPNWFDEMYYTGTFRDSSNKLHYTLMTKPDGKYIAKTRWGSDVLKDVEERHLYQCLKAIYDFYEPSAPGHPPVLSATGQASTGQGTTGQTGGGQGTN